MSNYIALTTVVEAFRCMREGFVSHLGERPVIGKSEAANLIRIHPQRERLEFLLGVAYGRKVEIDEAEFRHLEEHGSDDQELSGWGPSESHWTFDESLSEYVRSGGVYYKQYREDEPRFRAEADKEVIEVYLDDEAAASNVNERDPSATLVFTLNDASLLFHLVPGFRFDSAMFDSRHG